LSVVSKYQAHLPNPFHMEEEDEFVEGDTLVDWRRY